MLLTVQCAVQCAETHTLRVHTCVLRTISHDTLAIRAIMHASLALEGFSVINNYSAVRRALLHADQARRRRSASLWIGSSTVAFD